MAPSSPVIRSPVSAAGSHAPARPVGAMKWLLIQLLLLFLLACIFDPADKLLGVKVWLFVLCWLMTIALCLISRQGRSVPFGLLIYTLSFILVPVLSIAWYWVSDGSEPFEGFNLLKGYLLIAFAPLLVLARINLLPYLSAVLTALATVVILVFTALQVEPDLYGAVYLFGESTGIVLPDVRDYGSGITSLQVYFVTSPMLVISIAYYFDLAVKAPARKTRLLYFALMLVNIAGMLLAGTRNNLVVSLLLPITLFMLYAKNKVLSSLVGIGMVIVLAVLLADELRAFLDPAEFSNSIKLSLLKDYGDIFSDPWILLFGQGLGAYHHWAAKGLSFYITELTYLELLRNFGLVGALIMLGLVFFPVFHAFFSRRYIPGNLALIFAYAFYLLMCASNPNLFSSMGILILSVILANTFMTSRKRSRPARGH
jgi:hypothetical protein